MDKETELAAEIEKIRQLARENKNIDEQALITALLEAHAAVETLPGAEVVRAYIVSLLIPPLGLYYAIKFWLRSETDARKTAYICLALTAASVIITFWLAGSILSSPEIKNIQSITPEQIRELTQ